MTPATSWTSDCGQVTSFLLKIVLAIAVLGFLAVEFGSPVVTKVTLDNDAQNLAREGGHLVARYGDIDRARSELDADVAAAGAELREFEVVGDPLAGPSNPAELRIVVAKPAKSMFAHNVGALKGYYDVEVEASAPIR